MPKKNVQKSYRRKFIPYYCFPKVQPCFKKSEEKKKMTVFFITFVDLWLGYNCLINLITGSGSN